MALEKHFDWIYRTDDGLQLLLPRTVAEQVIIQGGRTMQDHINDNRHLYASERIALVKTNQAGGYLKLDANGWVPLEHMEDSLLAVKIEYADIDDMLANSADVKPGTLVMVLDASGDPHIKSGWAIYRRNLNSPEYGDLELGWKCIAESQVIDLDMRWESIPDGPESTAAAVDKMVTDHHNHADMSMLNRISESADGKSLEFDGIELAYMKDVAKFVDSPFIEHELRIGDFWIKESYGQSWWTDPVVEYAGTSCYEKYREYDTMVTAPKLRTQDVTSMCRMFFKDYDLVELQQYDTRKVEDFTGMYSECASIVTAPCMWTKVGRVFDNMWYKCAMLQYSPEMQLDNALSVFGMYSGCTSLEYVLPFGDTKKISNMRQWFNGCTSLKKIYSPIDFTAITADDAVVSMFNECLDLEEVEFVENTLKVSISLANTNLTKESILGILQGLPNVDNSPTLTLSGIPSLSTLTDEDFADAEAKGWTIVR